ncbi:hypothetical protein [Actinocrispum wychmicini]|uniref:Head-to-tail stopper n=1 Tax=Actinocrispum wychmicini TaxID=1213861 RepID=A0A4R2JX05_9PSEU|nr:hypothetical protein [Actinocrispum wychmicini]TCO64384.1 hypothetical protein EV192_101152 [Actinocrispum wychmicini]
MHPPNFVLPHAVAVRPYLGPGPYGDVFGDPVVVRRAFVEDRRRLVRSPDGEEVVSETTVRTRRNERIPLGSKVTVWQGTPHERTATVITVSVLDHPSSWSHLEITLT